MIISFTAPFSMRNSTATRSATCCCGPSDLAEADDATDARPQHVGGDPEHLGDGRLRIGHRQQPLVRDSGQRINRIARLQVGDALLGAPAV
jgi:hypothetical protein